MIEYSVDSATSRLTIGANRMPQSLLQRMQIALKDTMLNWASALNLRHACIFCLGDDQNRSTLPQLHTLVANYNPPFSMVFSHAHQQDSTRLFMMNRTQKEDDYWLAPLVS